MNFDDDWDWEGLEEQLGIKLQNPVVRSNENELVQNNVGVVSGQQDFEDIQSNKILQGTEDRNVYRRDIQENVSAVMDDFENIDGLYDQVSNSQQNNEQENEAQEEALLFSGRRVLLTCPTTTEGIKIHVDRAKYWIYPNQVIKRSYQFDIVQSAIFNNTLVCLPTGLGKTLIAAVVMYNFYRWFPEGVIVFTAPTRPLVDQQMNACINLIGIPRDRVTEMTGSKSPETRQQLWNNSQVFFCTPQTLDNDVRKGICPIKKIVCLTVDECHRAKGDAGIVKAIQHLQENNIKFRVVGLSATPGSTKEAVQEVIDNLMISRVEFRSEEEEDIKQYTHDRVVREVIVDSTDPRMHDCMQLLYGAIRLVVGDLVNKRLIEVYRDDYAMFNSYVLMMKRQENASGNQQAYFLFTQAIFLTKLRDKLEMYGVQSAKEFMEQQIAQNGIVKNCQSSVIQFKDRLMRIPNVDASEPKIKALKEIVAEHINQYQDDEVSSPRIIVFTNLRECVHQIVESINSQEDSVIKARMFIGQNTSDSGKGRGMTQKEQKIVLKDFAQGKFNTLVATCIGEEGLDIPQVGMIVCYDANASPIRNIQRIGRTGRHKEGVVVYLIAKGLEEEKFYRNKQREAKLKDSLRQAHQFFKLYRFNPRMIPPNFDPILLEMDTSPQEPTQAPQLKLKPNKKSKRQQTARRLKQALNAYTDCLEDGADNNENSNPEKSRQNQKGRKTKVEKPTIKKRLNKHQKQMEAINQLMQQSQLSQEDQDRQEQSSSEEFFEKQTQAKRKLFSHENETAFQILESPLKRQKFVSSELNFVNCKNERSWQQRNQIKETDDFDLGQKYNDSNGYQDFYDRGVNIKVCDQILGEKDVNRKNSVRPRDSFNCQQTDGNEEHSNIDSGNNGRSDEVSNQLKDFYDQDWTEQEKVEQPYRPVLQQRIAKAQALNDNELCMQKPQPLQHVRQSMHVESFERNVFTQREIEDQSQDQQHLQYSEELNHSQELRDWIPVESFERNVFTQREIEDSPQNDYTNSDLQSQRQQSKDSDINNSGSNQDNEISIIDNIEEDFGSQRDKQDENIDSLREDSADNFRHRVCQKLKSNTQILNDVFQQRTNDQLAVEYQKEADYFRQDEQNKQAELEYKDSRLVAPELQREPLLHPFSWYCFSSGSRLKYQCPNGQQRADHHDVVIPETPEVDKQSTKAVKVQARSISNQNNTLKFQPNKSSPLKTPCFKSRYKNTTESNFVDISEYSPLQNISTNLTQGGSCQKAVGTKVINLNTNNITSNYVQNGNCLEAVGTNVIDLKSREAWQISGSESQLIEKELRDLNDRKGLYDPTQELNDHVQQACTNKRRRVIDSCSPVEQSDMQKSCDVGIGNKEDTQSGQLCPDKENNKQDLAAVSLPAFGFLDNTQQVIEEFQQIGNEKKRRIIDSCSPKEEPKIFKEGKIGHNNGYSESGLFDKYIQDSQLFPRSIVKNMKNKNNNKKKKLKRMYKSCIFVDDVAEDEDEENSEDDDHLKEDDFDTQNYSHDSFINDENDDQDDSEDEKRGYEDMMALYQQQRKELENTPQLGKRNARLNQLSREEVYSITPPTHSDSEPYESSFIDDNATPQTMYSSQQLQQQKQQQQYTPGEQQELLISVSDKNNQQTNQNNQIIIDLVEDERPIEKNVSLQLYGQLSSEICANLQNGQHKNNTNAQNISEQEQQSKDNSEKDEFRYSILFEVDSADDQF